MDYWFYDSNATLGGKPCLRHSVTKELSLFGKYGEIYEVNQDTYAARIWATDEVKLSKFTKAQYSKFDEALVKFKADELNMWCDLLQVPLHVPTMLKNEELSRNYTP